MLQTKIIATLGPASSSAECLKSLLGAGVSVFRLNASHGTWEEHTSGIQLIRETAASKGLGGCDLAGSARDEITPGKV